MKSPKNRSVAKANGKSSTDRHTGFYIRVSTAGQQEKDVPEQTLGHQPRGTLLRLVALVKKTFPWGKE